MFEISGCKGLVSEQLKDKVHITIYFLQPVYPPHMVFKFSFGRKGILTNSAFFFLNLKVHSFNMSDKRFSSAEGA